MIPKTKSVCIKSREDLGEISSKGYLFGISVHFFFLPNVNKVRSQRKA
jgi:hypothetical protein